MRYYNKGKNVVLPVDLFLACRSASGAKLRTGCLAEVTSSSRTDSANCAMFVEEFRLVWRRHLAIETAFSSVSTLD